MSTEETPNEQPTEAHPETIEFLTWLAETPSEFERFVKLVEDIRQHKYPGRAEITTEKPKKKRKTTTTQMTKQEDGTIKITSDCLG